MSTGKLPATTARRALWFGGLLVLLAGIVGMHGMNSHAGGMDPAAHAVVLHESGAAAVAPSGHTAMAAAIPEVAGPAVTMAANLAAYLVAAGESGVDGGMAGLCMAVLALALTVLLRMLGSAPALPLYRLSGAPVGSPAAHARDPDPPSLIQLSIQRC